MDRQDAARIGVVSAGGEDTGGPAGLLRRAVSAWSRWTRRTTRCRANATARCGPIEPRRDSRLTSKPFRCSPSTRPRRRRCPRRFGRTTRSPGCISRTFRRRPSTRCGTASSRALAPLHEAGKLGAILLQFPQWFPGGKTNRQYILECAERCKPYRVSVEFRNRSWMDPDRQDQTLDFLRGYGLSYVCVDMPQGFTSSIPPVVAATADLAVVRFHGHNDEGWTAATSTSDSATATPRRNCRMGTEASRARGERQRDPRTHEQLLSRLRADERGAAGGADLSECAMQVRLGRFPRGTPSKLSLTLASLRQGLTGSGPLGLVRARSSNCARFSPVNADAKIET